MELKKERKDRAELADEALDEVAGGMMEPCLIRHWCCYCKIERTVSDCGMVKIKPADTNGKLLSASRLYCKTCNRFYYKAHRDGGIVYYSEDMKLVP